MSGRSRGRQRNFESFSGLQRSRGELFLLTLQNNKLKDARKKVNRVAGGNAGASAGDKPADETAKDEGAAKDEDAGKNDEDASKEKGIRAKRKRKKADKD